MQPIAPVQDPTINPNDGLSDRGRDYMKRADLTIKEITQNVIRVFVENGKLAPQKLIDKYVTPETEEKISKLDDKVKIIYQAMLFDVYRFIGTNHSQILSGLMMFDLLLGAGTQGRLVKAVALPSIQNLVNSLHKDIPGIIDELTSTGVTPETTQLLTKLNISFN